MSEQNRPQHEWVFVYYMSYDNNLAYCGPVILEELEHGVKASELVVTVLYDDESKEGLKRYTITSEGRKYELLDTDNSASEEVLYNYLTWVAEHYPSKHHAVIFLDHGGRLDEMCFDEWPGENENKHWLSARLASSVIRKFRKEIAGEVDLLFLQQCGRGSLENLYNFRDAAATVMASQMNVGAPNTYYEPTLKWLARHKNASGVEIAKQIMSNDEHFSNYVCLDGKAIEQIPAQINPLIDALLGNEGQELISITRGKPCFQYKTEKNYDLMNWFQNMFKENNIPKEQLDKFEKWLHEHLIYAVVSHPDRSESLKHLCGISLFVPESKEAYEEYSDYPIYMDSNLGALWKIIYQIDTKSRED